MRAPAQLTAPGERAVGYEHSRLGAQDRRRHCDPCGGTQAQCDRPGRKPRGRRAATATGIPGRLAADGAAGAVTAVAVAAAVTWRAGPGQVGGTRTRGGAVDRRAGRAGAALADPRAAAPRQRGPAGRARPPRYSGGAQRSAGPTAYSSRSARHIALYMAITGLQTPKFAGSPAVAADLPPPPERLVSVRSRRQRERWHAARIHRRCLSHGACIRGCA